MANRLFISYSHKDKDWLARLHQHLAQLHREGAYESWYDREIQAGDKFDESIKVALRTSSVFIACASPDYIASNYCYQKELEVALELEDEGKMTVVPLIFEPCDWLATPLAKFKAVPNDGKAISLYTNPNVAFLEVVNELRRLADSSDKIKSNSNWPLDMSAASRYRVRREFDKLDTRDFIESYFKEIYDFFSASVGELSQLPLIEARLSPLAADHFSCTIINRGVSRGFETLHVRMGGSWGAIDILFGETNARNTSNGGFSVDAGEFDLSLTSTMGFGSDRERLSAKQSGQLLWDNLLQRVGISYA